MYCIFKDGKLRKLSEKMFFVGKVEAGELTGIVRIAADSEDKLYLDKIAAEYWSAPDRESELELLLNGKPYDNGNYLIIEEDNCE